MRRMRIIYALLFTVLFAVPNMVQAVQGEPAFLQTVLMNGQEFDLEKHRGKVVMVNFWATWCPACRADFPVWQRVYDSYRGGDFEMIAVSIDRDKDALHPFLKKYAYTVPVSWRFDGREKDAFPKLRNTPTAYFIDRDGKVAGSRIGRIEEAELRSTVEGLLQQP